MSENTPDMTLSDYIWTVFWPEIAPPLAKKTRQIHVGLFRRLDEFLGDKRIRDIGSKDIRDWAESPWMTLSQRTDCKCAPRTRRSRLYLIRNLFRRASSDLGLERSLADFLPKLPPREARESLPVLTRRQLHAFLGVARRDSELDSEIAMIAVTGMRSGAMSSVRRSDLVLERSAVRVTDGDREEARWVPLTSLARDAIRTRLDEPTENSDEPLFRTGRGTSRRALREEMNRLAYELALPHRVGPRILRRTFERLCHNGGIDADVINAILGRNLDGERSPAAVCSLGAMGQIADDLEFALGTPS